MRNNQYNKDFKFVIAPESFSKYTNKELLQYCLGATLYMPGTKEIKDKIINKELTDLTSMVMCFEDSIQESSLVEAEENVIEHLLALSNAINNNILCIDDIPLIFLRVRSLQQFKSFSSKLNHELVEVLTGFVFPKFNSSNAIDYLNQLREINFRYDTKLYAMPILESPTLVYVETRVSEMLKIKNILASYRDLILNIRVGGTDFSSVFGVRRGINYSIYDIHTIRDCLSDIINIFTRCNEGYTVSGPVWEYFLAYKKDDINKLINKNIHRSLLYGNEIINDAIDGLLKEVVLDKANGFVGKTIIHPSHLRFVNGMQAVTKEEYDDASQILDTKGGVVKSCKSNKMNEINPHRNWAKKTINRAKAFGVIENEASYLKLILG